MRADIPGQLPHAGAPPPGRRARTARGGLGDAAALALLSAYLLLYFARLALGPRGAVLEAVGALARLPVFGVAAAALAWRAGDARGVGPAVRRGWRLMALAHLPVAVASAAWGAYLAVGRTTLPGWLDWTTLAFYPLALASLLAFPAAPRAAAGRARFVLDAATVAVAGGTLAWHLVAAPAARVGFGPAAAALAYPAGDLVLLGGVVSLTLRTGSAAGALALQVLALALGVAIGADFLYANQTLRGAYVAGGWTDALWAASSWTTALAGYLQRWTADAARASAGPGAGPAKAEPGPAAGSAAPPVPVARAHTLLPYAGVAAVYLVLLADARTRQHAPLGLVVGAGALTVLAFARQAVAQRENAALVAERLAHEARFRALVEHSSDVIAVLDRAGRVSFVSPSVAPVFAAAPEALLGVRLLALAHPGDRRRVARLLGAGRLRTARGEDELSGESRGVIGSVTWRVEHPHLGWRHVESVATDRLGDPAVRGVVLNTRDVTERVRLEEALSRRANHDPLTGLANRARLHERLAAAVGAAATGRASGVAVLLVDLDGFKAVNDTLGHAAGDALLVAVARRLEHATRHADTVARLGGDEFALVLADVDGAAEAEAVATRALAALRAPVALEAGAAAVGASIGLTVASAARARALAAELGPDAIGPALLGEADTAMYRAKAAGKNRVVCTEAPAAGADGEADPTPVGGAAPNEERRVLC